MTHVDCLYFADIGKICTKRCYIVTRRLDILSGRPSRERGRCHLAGRQLAQ